MRDTKITEDQFLLLSVRSWAGHCRADWRGPISYISGPASSGGPSSREGLHADCVAGFAEDVAFEWVALLPTRLPLACQLLLTVLTHRQMNIHLLQRNDLDRKSSIKRCII